MSLPVISGKVKLKQFHVFLNHFLPYIRLKCFLKRCVGFLQSEHEFSQTSLLFQTSHPLTGFSFEMIWVIGEVRKIPEV